MILKISVLDFMITLKTSLINFQKSIIPNGELNHGGAENSLFRQYKNLLKNIYKVSVICLNGYFYKKN